MTLPTLLAHRLAARPAERHWLIDALWGDEAVGILGGEPKSCKSFLALQMAVAVAGGVPCLDRFAPARTGRVLLYAAEDAAHIVRQRLAGIATAAGRALADLDIHVITAPSLRLDVEADRDALDATIAALDPTLLVLDPFVRLHRIDENVSGEVAPLLAYLRDLQRRHHVAVVLVHHARKGGAKMRGGQALRGSSEFHAWGDSNLYLRRHGDQLTLSIEHRAAPAPAPISLHLATEGDAVALVTTARPLADTAPAAVATAPALAAVGAAPAPRTAEQRIEEQLAAAGAPMTAAALRKACQIRNATLTAALAALVAAGRVCKGCGSFASAKS